jgi:hypothetical protein
MTYADFWTFSEKTMSPLRQVLGTGGCLEFVFAIYFVFDSLLFLRIEFTSIEKLLLLLLLFILLLPLLLLVVVAVH